jgi:AcrR family transcriptional regulator
VRARRGARAPSSRQETPYHHGALRDALLEAAERVLERDGLAGLTLRAVAREAGVSHAAPTHHFGDLTGLLSELAAIGFRRFNAEMSAARAAGAGPVERAMAPAKAYVAYAQAHPGMYGLMFRGERLD